ncbi:hypothetical protein HOLleu_37472 [Holothuria leucospilota]|uniref:Uncharacterized protein n=1 Tax=Holothuria leucospilota TaxID=206669 RepID=A0A9Q0YKZ9_HOLLE|nr:hypothetical protein HOLleu_37472 [Holothuria leucospilota]
MRYGERKNPIIFGGGQRSSGVTRGQTLKTLLTRYLEMPFIKRKNCIVLVGFKGHLGVTGGQTLKILLTQYLQVGSLDRYHT